MELSAKRVDEILLECLYKEEEVLEGKPPKDAVVVEGIMGKFGLHPQRVEAHRQEVKEMLDDLPRQFREKEGGGWSFLNACMTEGGRQWGEQRDVQSLLVLGLGLGLVSYSLPRSLWSALPGGVPYFTIKAQAEGIPS